MTTQPSLFGRFASTTARQGDLFAGTTPDTGRRCGCCGRGLVETASGYLCCPRGHGKLLDVTAAADGRRGLFN